VQLRAPSSNLATCACDGCASGQSVGYQQIWYWRTGNCGTTNPFLNGISFRAADSATKFRVYTTRVASVAPATYFYGAGSSMKLTSDSVSCFNAAFRPGYDSSLILNAGGIGEVMVVLYCDSPSGCAFEWRVDGGCTSATVSNTVSGVQMDSCLASCNPIRRAAHAAPASAPATADGAAHDAAWRPMPRPSRPSRPLHARRARPATTDAASPPADWSCRPAAAATAATAASCLRAT